MKCQNCHSNLKKGQAYCSNCGSLAEASNMSDDISESSVVSDAGIIATKMSKKKLIALIACIVAFVMLVVVILGNKKTTDKNNKHNCEEVAIKWAKSCWEYDYDEIKACLPYDIDEMFEDWLAKVCHEGGVSLQEVYEEIENEFEIEINDTDNLLEKIFVSADRALQHFFETAVEEVEVLSIRELKGHEIEDAIDNINDTFHYFYYYNYSGVEIDIDLNDYINKYKIKKCYEVKISFTVNLDRYYNLSGEDTYTEEETFIVVKYGDNWKVLTLFDFSTLFD